MAVAEQELAASVVYSACEKKHIALFQKPKPKEIPYIESEPEPKESYYVPPPKTRYIPEPKTNYNNHSSTIRSADQIERLLGDMFFDKGYTPGKRQIETVKNNNQLAREKHKTIKPISSALFTRGSPKKKVLQLQGKPDSITPHHTYEVWHYGYSSVKISLQTNKVISWYDTSGNLKVE